MSKLLALKNNLCKKATLIFFAFIFSIYWAFDKYSGFAVNVTNSLPYKIFILNKLEHPSLGKYVLFKAPKNSGLPCETIMTKKILGQPGDVVTIKDKSIYINNKFIANLKKASSHGEALLPGQVGKLREGEYYVGSPHPDSLDSRYMKIGWINRAEIIAVAYPIF